MFTEQKNNMITAMGKLIEKKVKYPNPYKDHKVYRIGSLPYRKKCTSPSMEVLMVPDKNKKALLAKHTNNVPHFRAEHQGRGRYTGEMLRRLRKEGRR